MTSSAITVYGATWCPDCKRAKQFLGEQRVPYRWVDIEEDEDSRRFVAQVNNGKQIIPTIVFEDGSMLVEPSNAELAEKLGIQSKARRDTYDLIIVGAGPAGLAAALYAAREGVDTLVIERAGIGGQAGATEFIENYPGFVEGVRGADLADRFRDHAARFDVEILAAQSVSGIQALGNHRLVRTESGDEYCSRALLVATGARYRRLGVPGEEDLIGAGVHFCASCDGPFYKGRELLVVGGGNSGVEEGLFLTRFASKITLVEIGDRLRASKILQDKLDSHPEIDVRLNTTVQELKGAARVEEVMLKNTETNETSALTPAGVFVFIGLDPASEFVRDQLEVDQFGFIETGDNLGTNIPGVFAAGDVRKGSTKQVASAVGDGVAAALMIRQYLEKN